MIPKNRCATLCQDNTVGNVVFVSQYFPHALHVIQASSYSTVAFCSKTVLQSYQLQLQAKTGTIVTGNNYT